MNSFVYARRTTFAESDGAGVIHFSRAACYVEEAEHAWLEARGFPLTLEGDDVRAWPRVAFQASYLLPLRPWQDLQVELELSAAGKSSLSWAWRIRLADGRLAAEGTMKTVCCCRRAGQMEAAPLPAGLLKGL